MRPHPLQPSNPSTGDLFSPLSRPLPRPVPQPWVPLTSSRLATVLEEQSDDSPESETPALSQTQTRLNPSAMHYSPTSPPRQPLTPRPRPTEFEWDSPPASPEPLFAPLPRRHQQQYSNGFERPPTPPSEHELQDRRRDSEKRSLGEGVGLGRGGGLTSQPVTGAWWTTLESRSGHGRQSGEGVGARTGHSPRVSAELEQGQEKATRYLLVAGLPHRATESELRSTLIKHLSPTDLVACATHLLPEHGSVILRFADPRAVPLAMKVVEGLGRGLKVMQLDRPAVAQTDPLTAFLSPSEGYLTVSLLTPISDFASPGHAPSVAPSSIAELLPALLPALQSFGSLRSIREVRGEKKVMVVEYWDEQHAETAAKAMDGGRVGAARVGVEREPGCATPASGAKASALGSAVTPIATRDTPQRPSPPTLQPRARFPPHFEYQPLPASPSPSLPLLNSDDIGAGAPRPFDGQRNPSQHRQQSREVQAPPSPWRSPAPSTSTFGPVGRPKLATPHSPAPLSPSPVSIRTPSLPQRSLAQPNPTASPLPSALGPQYGIYRDDPVPTSNVVHFERIEAGLDVRTTLMIRNLPNRMGDEDLRIFIEEAAGTCYDLIYVRRDWATDLNVGYSFVNFTSSYSLLEFCRKKVGTRWNLYGSDKLVMASYANIQGKQSLVSHFRSSAVLDQPPSRQPKLFVSAGPRQGEPEPFPACDDPVRQQRSRENAQAGGLWHGDKRPVFKVTRALGSLNI